MPKFRADFDVKATLVLTDNSEPFVLSGNSPEFQITLHNAQRDSSGHVPFLDIHVVASADSIDQAPQKLRQILAEQLDVLSFVTNSAYKIDQCYRVMEWEPGQRTRAFKALQKFDPLYPPNPDLSPQVIPTIQEMISSGFPDYVQRGFKYFRHGLMEPQLEDQFQDFWLVIETIATGIKSTAKAPIPCPVCSGALMCKCCNASPLRMPMNRQAIKSMLVSLLGQNGHIAYSDLVRVRDKMLHGGSLDSTLASIGRSLKDIVEGAGQIAWNAILRALPPPQSQRVFMLRGNLSNGELIAGPSGSFDHTDSGDHPPESKIPRINISLQTRFAPIPAQTSGS